MPSACNSRAAATPNATTDTSAIALHLTKDQVDAGAELARESLDAAALSDAALSDAARRVVCSSLMRLRRPTARWVSARVIHLRASQAEDGVQRAGIRRQRRRSDGARGGSRTPTPGKRNKDLNLARLPIPPPGLWMGGGQYGATARRSTRRWRAAREKNTRPARSMLPRAPGTAARLDPWRSDRTSGE